MNLMIFTSKMFEVFTPGEMFFTPNMLFNYFCVNVILKRLPAELIFMKNISF